MARMTTTALARYLAKRGMTQSEFAVRIESPPCMVSQYAAGKRLPGLAVALAIEEATEGEVPARYWVGLGAGRRRARRAA